MTYITRIANKRILAKYFLYGLQINYLNWKPSASRSIFSCYATFVQSKFSLILESTILQYTVILSDLQVQFEFSLLCLTHSLFSKF